MTKAVLPPRAPDDTTAGPKTDHELISFAVFLDYRARRMRAPVAEPPSPEAPTTDTVPVQS